MIINASYISEYTSTYYLHRFRIHTISTNQSLTFNVCICVWLARSRCRLQICCIKLRVDRKTLAETFSFWLSCTQATHAYIHTHTAPAEGGKSGRQVRAGIIAALAEEALFCLKKKQRV